MWLALILVALILPALCGVVALGAARALEVFRLRVRDGQVWYVRGRLSPSLLRELEAVLGRSRANGRVRVRRSRSKVVVVAEGIDPGTLQQVRNVIGLVPLQRLVSAAPLRRHWQPPTMPRS